MSWIGNVNRTTILGLEERNEEAGSSKTSVTSYNNKRCRTPEDQLSVSHFAIKHRQASGVKVGGSVTNTITITQQIV
jgi:hypothetical protein